MQFISVPWENQTKTTYFSSVLKRGCYRMGDEDHFFSRLNETFYTGCFKSVSDEPFCIALILNQMLLHYPTPRIFLFLRVP